MKVKFNRFEKVAGLFVGLAVLGFVFATLGVAIKKGWFSSKVDFSTTMTTADGIHPGTLVQISGLRAGAVDDVELISATEVKVRFHVLDKFEHQIRQDSVVQVFRPFIIGEKVLEVTVGEKDQPQMQAKSELPLRPTFDVMDLLGGRKMNAFVSTFDRMAESIRIFAEAFADPERSRALVAMVDHMAPLIKNLNTMSLQVTKVTDTALKEKRLETMLSNLSEMTDTMNQILPQFAEEAPDLGRQMAQVVQNLNVLTGEFKKLTPAISEIAPDLPRTTRRAVEALDETVVVLKAIQRSWFFRSNVKDIKKEEELRMPANEGK